MTGEKLRRIWDESDAFLSTDDEIEQFLVQDRNSEGEEDDGNKYERLANVDQSREQTQVLQDSIDTLESEDETLTTLLSHCQ